MLVLSDLYPRPTQPIFGVFVEEQTRYLQPYCHQVVVSPTRTFPPLRVFRKLPSVSRFRYAWQQWHDDLNATPENTIRHGLPVYYPRYTSPPKQLTYGVWGWFAYPYLVSLLQRLHAEHQFDLIHAHGAASSGTVALLAKRWMNVPVVVTEHGTDVQYIVHLNALCRAEVRSVFGQADAVLANSRRTVQNVIRYGAPPDRVHLVYLGTDQTPVTPLLTPRSPDTPIRLLSVARLVPEKGIQWVLHAMKRLIDEGIALHYTVVGEGDYRPSLESLVACLGLSEVVEFTGSKSRADIPACFAACDIFVLPSDPESFGIVYVEALSQGKPIIGSDCSGAVDLQTFYPDGAEVVRSHDLDSLTHSLRQLITDPDRRQRVQQGGPRLVAERFTWERTARETALLYMALLNRPIVREDEWLWHPQ